MFKPNELEILPLKRRCTRYDAVIRLCPCIHLTSQDRSHARILRWSTLTPPPSHYGCFGLEQDGWLLESHICPFHSNKNQEARIAMEMSISDEGRINFNVWYTLNFPVSSGDPSGVVKPLLACPHLNLFDLVHTTGDMSECRRCFSYVFRGPESPDGSGLVTFTARRRLGWADESDYLFWKWHCYVTEGKYQYDFRVLALVSTCLLTVFSCLSQDLRNGSNIWHGRRPQSTLKTTEPMVLRGVLRDS